MTKATIGDIIWFLSRTSRRAADKEYGIITATYVNVVHAVAFKDGKQEAFFPQTFGTYWGVLKQMPEIVSFLFGVLFVYIIVIARTSKEDE